MHQLNTHDYFWALLFIYKLIIQYILYKYRFNMGICSSDQQFYNNIFQIKQRAKPVDSNLKELMDLSFEQIKVERSACCPKNTIRSSVRPNLVNIYNANKSFYIQQTTKLNGFSTGAIFYKDCMYIGSFREGVPHGLGESYHHTGEREQKGNWNQGVFVSGQIYLCTDQDIEKIKVTSDQNSSQIYEINFKDKTTYRGQGKITKQGNFLRHGKGVFKDLEERYEYDGFWQFNKRQGQAKVKMKNTTFAGVFKNDMKFQGVLIRGNQKYDGKWEEGNLFTGKLQNTRKRNIKNVVNNIVVQQR